MLAAVLLAGAGRWAAAQQLSDSEEVASLPDAPQAQAATKTTDAQPASAPKKCEPPSKGQGLGGAAGASEPPKNGAAPCRQKFDFAYPLGKPPGHGHQLTSMDKARIAASDVVDPFNLLTIGATAAISIGSDPHTGYGPGMEGFAKNALTLLTEDMSGAFFATYLIPSITRQDPRYYRMPNASIPRRIENVLIQPVWSRSDKGNPMPNFGMLLGVPAAVALANIYVPGRKQGVWPIVQTSAIAIATSPIDNIVNEFLPDVAKRVKIRIVIIQKVVNHLTLTEGSS
jgi:hypothetical protein